MTDPTCALMIVSTSRTVTIAMPEIVPCTQIDAAIKAVNVCLGEILEGGDGGTTAFLKRQCVSCTGWDRAVGACRKRQGSVVAVVGAGAVAVVARVGR